jgi:hypothetical protein
MACGAGIAPLRRKFTEITVADNPFAPPRAKLSDVVEKTSPPLWNPNAAVNWSLLFSPVFGAVIHMKNWQALGELRKASAAKGWAVLSVLVLLGFGVASILLPNDRNMGGLARAAGFALLIAWYLSSGRAQAVYVKDRFGAEYPRRGWARPLLFAALSLVGFFVAMGIVALIASRSVGLE